MPGPQRLQQPDSTLRNVYWEWFKEIRHPNPNLSGNLQATTSSQELTKADKC